MCLTQRDMEVTRGEPSIQIEEHFVFTPMKHPSSGREPVLYLALSFLSLPLVKSKLFAGIKVTWLRTGQSSASDLFIFKANLSMQIL